MIRYPSLLLPLVLLVSACHRPCCDPEPGCIIPPAQTFYGNTIRYFEPPMIFTASGRVIDTALIRTFMNRYPDYFFDAGKTVNIRYDSIRFDGDRTAYLNGPTAFTVTCTGPSLLLTQPDTLFANNITDTSWTSFIEPFLFTHWFRHYELYQPSSGPQLSVREVPALLAGYDGHEVTYPNLSMYYRRSPSATVSGGFGLTSGYMNGANPNPVISLKPGDTVVLQEGYRYFYR